MNSLPIFVSIVCVTRNQASQLECLIKSVSSQLSPHVRDYEFIIIDNASTDHSSDVLEKLTGANGLPNIQVYALTKKVTVDIAVWVGIENALGDFIAVFDPETDDISFLPEMLAKAASGVDIVFASNKEKPVRSYAYRVAYAIFNVLFQLFTGVNLTKEAPNYRVISRHAANFILRHPQQSTMAYRYLPAAGGFSRASMEYSAVLDKKNVKRLRTNIERGIRLLFSTTQIPMRIVTGLTLFGAVINLLYSVYVVVIGIMKTDVAPGWISLSLQQSGMFFLVSLVLMVLGEYILHVVSLANGAPLYHIGRELTSAHMSHKKRLNIDAPPHTTQPVGDRQMP